MVDMLGGVALDKVFLRTSAIVGRQVLKHRRPVVLRLFDEPEALRGEISEEFKAMLAI